jgi:hypothetical protein
MARAVGTKRAVKAKRAKPAKKANSTRRASDPAFERLLQESARSARLNVAYLRPYSQK